jgi:dTDP-4-amino-4,6-dideoxygalactose transaminase
LRHTAAQPEAIIPAYGCPQLVSACLHAGVRPRVVDVARGQWGYELELLRAALTPNTVAILAVNLLGYGDQAAELLPLARVNGSALIQDSAQHVPARVAPQWCGDYVVLSFGRGKPVNLLRGGALAVPADRPLLEDAPVMTSLKETVLASRFAAAAFNVITHPRVYGMATRLPGLGLGETEYSPATDVARLPESAWRQVGPGYEKYGMESWRFPWSEVLPRWESLGLRELTGATDRRLRLALLARDREQRDRLVARLSRAGLGATNMYGVAIDRIKGIPAEIRAQGPFGNATGLAERLLTLPTHAAVTAAIVRRTDDCLRSEGN